MNNFQMAIVQIVALAGSLTACTADIHDNTVNIDAKVDVTSTVNLDDIQAGQAVPVKATVTNVYLVEPSATPPATHTTDAGHLRYYLDDVATTPLIITAQVSVDVKIPVTTPAGKHKVICRVHKHDGTPTTTTFELSITVKASVTVGTDAGSTAD